MVENCRDPNKKYVKIEDIIAMNIPLLNPIEVGIRPDAENDVDRGDILETILVYYAGVSRRNYYDILQYYERLFNGKPIDPESGAISPLNIELPLIDYIRILPKINGKPVEIVNWIMLPIAEHVKLSLKD